MYPVRRQALDMLRARRLPPPVVNLLNSCAHHLSRARQLGSTTQVIHKIAYKEESLACKRYCRLVTVTNIRAS